MSLYKTKKMIADVWCRWFKHRTTSWMIKLNDAHHTQLLSITEWVQAVDDTVQNFLQHMLLIQQAGQASVYQTDQIHQQISGIIESASRVQSSAVETGILAINLLVDSAKQANSRQHLANMANQVQNLAQQSAGFSQGIVDEVETAQNALKQVKQLIMQVSQRGLEAALTMKQQVDFSLSCLQTVHRIAMKAQINQGVSSLDLLLEAKQSIQKVCATLNTIAKKLALLITDEGLSSLDIAQIKSIEERCLALASAKIQEHAAS